MVVGLPTAHGSGKRAQNRLACFIFRFDAPDLQRARALLLVMLSY